MMSDATFTRFALTAATFAVGLSFGLAVAVVRAEAPPPRDAAPILEAFFPHSATQEI